MAKISRSLPLTAVLLSGCNCDFEVVTPPGDLVGIVCSEETGEPLVGAAVVVSGGSHRESITDGVGRYLFTGLPPADYTVTATFGDVVREFTDVVVKSDELFTVTDTACRRQAIAGETGTLDGQICNRHTGELVSEAEVRIELADGSLIADRTDAEGRFLIADIPTGTFVVDIRGSGYQRAFAIEIFVDSTTTLDLAQDCESVKLGEGGVIGSFCDPSTGDNLVGAGVTVAPVLGGPTEEEQHDVTDIEGEFEINGLLPGDYDVSVRSADYTFDTTFVHVVAGELTPVTDEASCGGRPEVGRIQGQLCDALAGGTFLGTVELKQGSTVVDTVQTSSDGRFSFNQVVPATYELRAFRSNPTFERLFSGVVVAAFRSTLVVEGDCPELDDICQQFESVPSSSADGRILLVVDKSGSMAQSFGGGGEKWDALRSTLVNVTASLTSTVEFGLVLFPERGGDTCDQGTQILGLQSNNADQIQSQLDATNPSGGTPTAPTLAVARQIVLPLVADNRPIAVVLATDGGPNCNDTLDNPCTCTDPDRSPSNCPATNCLDDANTYQQVTAIHDIGVNTFVIGITGAESFADVLDEMAVRGGAALQGPPGTPRYYAADDTAALEQALAHITRRVLACRITSPTNLTTVDSIEVSVAGQVLTQDDARQNGWDVINSTTIELFGSACDAAVASSDNVIVKTCVGQ